VGEAGFGRHPLIRGRQPSHDRLQLLSKHNYLHLRPLSI